MSSISNNDIDQFSFLKEVFFRALERKTQKGGVDNRLVVARGVVNNIVSRAEGCLDPKADNFGMALSIVHTVLDQCVSELKAAKIPQSSSLIKDASFTRDAYSPDPM